MRRTACALLLCLAMGVAPAWTQRLPATQPLPTWGPSGYVSAIERAGDRLFLGGSFSYVGPPSGGLALIDVNAPNAVHAVSPLPDFPERVASDGAGGWIVASRASATSAYYLQHLDATGAPASGWTTPAFALAGSQTSAVNLLAMVVNGGSVFIGGYFDSVNGVARPGLVALDVNTGAPLPWNPALEPAVGGTTIANVSHLAVTNGVVVAAGYFGSVGGVPRPGLAGFDATTAALTALAPTTCVLPDATVSLAADSGRVYRTCITTTTRFDAYELDGTPVAGWAPTDPVFRVLAATAQAIYVSSSAGQLAALHPTTGAPLPGFTPPGTFVTNVVLAAGRLFASNFPPGSTNTRVSAFDPLTGAPTGWSQLSADIRCLAADSVRVAVCSGSVGGIEARGLAAIDLRTGRAVPTADFGQATVTALHAIGDTIVVSTTATTATPNALRAFSASTGVPYPWSLTLNGSVWTFARTGRTLFGAGSFTIVDGHLRRGLLAIDLATASLSPLSQGVLGAVLAIGASNGRLYTFGTDAGGGQGLPTVAFDVDSLRPLPFAPSPPPGSVRGFAFAPGRVLTAGGINTPRVAAEWFALDGGTPIDVGNGMLLDFDAYSLSQWDNRIVMVGRRGGSLGFAAILDARTGRAALWDPAGDPAAYYSGVHTSPGIVAVTGVFNSVRGAPAFNLAVFPTVPLAAPTALTGAVSGSTASVRWTPSAGGAPSYVVEAGSAPGAADIAVIDVGTATTIGGPLPPGRYFVRVRAADGSETSPPSNEVVLLVPEGLTLPGTPGTLTSSVAGGVVSLSWGAATGAASYVIDAGTTSGATNIGSFPLAGTGTTFSAAVPPGTYFVRIRAVNAAGTSAPSNEVTVVVP